jgi:Tfp pilus assembly protein PilV
MQNRPPQSPNGFILVEALIALVIIGVVFLGLEGSLTLVLRSLADGERQTIATRTAEAQRERVFASICAGASGSDSVNAVSVDWVASSTGRLVRISQTSRYPTKTGARVDHYDAIGSCQ